ncbi:Callose synthase 7 [Phytophthora citrophthora]|uniref:Callose synthase 7 n=1 Tax=Phytophthora citrophthora TaxID=4793 RepID=A0AAD9GLC3_9STRA|nr:Callose synthase 7 [Phytophthora citrophthora]
MVWVVHTKFFFINSSDILDQCRYIPPVRTLLGCDLEKNVLAACELPGNPYVGLVLANPLRSRMHYGHPDVFEKSFVVTSGGVSKASKGINLSEDVFSGYNVTLRGGLVTHVEFMQCGKGRDVTLSQINAFEAKLSNGCAESCLSREGHRLTNSLDFSRLNSMFYGHFGFYICNALTVFCVYVYAYCKLYVATHSEVEVTAIMTTGSLNSLASVMTTQYLLQFGMLTTLPLFATLFVEFGFKQASLKVIELISTLGIVFYVFLTGTKAHFYDVALIRGGSKYRGTGRGFSITRDPMVNFFKEYGVSHFRKAVELIGVMILFGIYGSFDIGSNVLEEYCDNADFDCDKDPDQIPANITSLAAFSNKSQSYGIASFAVLFLGACHPLAMYYVFLTEFKLAATACITLSLSSVNSEVKWASKNTKALLTLSDLLFKKHLTILFVLPEH